MRPYRFIVFLLVLSCSNEPTTNPLENALNSNEEAIQRVMNNLKAHEVQIKLTTIKRSSSDVIFNDYEFQLDDNNYFYPASTVKFPAAILTLEKLNEQDQFTLDTPFFMEGDTVSTTFRKDIVDIFAVSSNHTFNHLFEYLGKDYMNQSFASKGIGPIQYHHRLATSDPAKLETIPLIFTINDSTLVATESITNMPIEPLALNRLKKGNGFYRGETLVNEPMDYSEKNYLPISTLHNILKRLIFPEAFIEQERFKLTNEQREFLINTMAMLPKDGGYLDDDHYDSYVKFFLFGDTKEPMPPHIKIHNKVGLAYGYLSDCAYIVDSKNNIEYMLTATIHVNEDGVYNDNVYEYDTVGIPFLAALGREIHSYLLKNN